ncbi:J domain-containing protein [Halorubrum lipolyticum]|uniref:Heat shock protein DnaJ domain protein n=1 Tax=Halorubrum lipolyticum DSM 21995 TaxID=1227482 RepID=M0NKZ8_9EURY|nr:J domain-containing protein [Halorubrum lipolyticum]EMA58258.1 heat shock protein DnaJ domain protein [Halorubrum lipolyticum DSM 21995]
MTNRAIVVGMAATFIGLTALLLVAGVVVSPVLLAVAVPFGVVSYFLWYHASGRLRDRVRREAARAGPGEQARARQRAKAAEHRRSAYRSAGATDGGFGRGGAGTARGARSASGAGARDPRDRAPPTGRMSEREAYETLGLDRTADSEAIRSTYRERAKRLHPDGEDGDEAAFKELNEAYELLRD